MAFSRVHRVARWPETEDSSAAAVPLPVPSPSFGDLTFALDGFEEPVESRDSQVDESAERTAATVRRLLTTDSQVVSAASLAAESTNGDLAALGSVLARLGFAVQLCTSAGGALRTLKHSFLTVSRCAGGEEWVVDPAFAAAFAVAAPTPRFAHILAAAPALLVAPLRRVVRAVVVLGAELARSFEARDAPLPPWRHVDALLTRYVAVSRTPVRPTNSGAAAPPAAESARQQRRAAEQLQGVQLRLVKLGVVAPEAAADDEPATPSPPSPSGAALLDGGSPRSVVDVQSAPAGPLARASFAVGVKQHERVCCAWRSRAPGARRRGAPQPPFRRRAACAA